MSDGSLIPKPDQFKGSSAILTPQDNGTSIKKTARTDSAAIRSVRNEIAHLSQLKHRHIIRLQQSGETETNLPWFTTEMGRANLRVALREELNRGGLSGEQRLEQALTKLAHWLLGIADALVYLHSNQILHLDIRPENILILTDETCCLIDFGGAVSLKTNTGEVTTQLTPWFTHPKLADAIFAAGEKNIQNLTVPFKRLSPQQDIFSFGRTILALLAIIDREFPDIIAYNYTFLYLHLMACRMLDAKNLSPEETMAVQQKTLQRGEHCDAYRETWLNFKPVDFKSIRYTSAQQIKEDFEKLLYPDRIYELIPEINPALDRRINIGDRAWAPATERVLAILTHPVFERLKSVPQLEMIDTIYPSANHTRFEHSIGVFRNAALYVHALYFDRYNPIFRQLGYPALYKAILLSALLHDLGQFPFGHTLEEALPELKHERFSIGFLENQTRDSHNRTLRDIIESKEFGWGISLTEVQQLIDIDLKNNNLFKDSSPVLTMASSIIDGPIDCDKLDYLQRDSHKCYLPYGSGIDEQRLIASLTIISQRDQNDNLKLILGCYEKGQSAAEALSFTRYLLYRSLYWHHSSRALRSMLAAAARSMTESGGKPAARLIREVENLLGLNGQVRTVDIRDMLNMIEKKANNPGKKLIAQLKQRQYYKNILTLTATQQNIDIEKFRTACQNPAFHGRVQHRIAEKFRANLAGSAAVGHSLLRPEKTDRTLQLLGEPLVILCDAPKPSTGAGERLYFIPEPDRLKKNYLSRSLSAERISDVWSGIHEQLMKFAARAMVFCHPDIRDPLMAALGPEGVEQAVLEAISL